MARRYLFSSATTVEFVLDTPYTDLRGLTTNLKVACMYYSFVNVVVE